MLTNISTWMKHMHSATHTHARAHTQTHTRTQARTHALTYSHNFSLSHARAHTHKDTHTHTKTHTHTHSHTNTHTHTHTHTHTAITHIHVQWIECCKLFLLIYNHWNLFRRSRDEITKKYLIEWKPIPHPWLKEWVKASDVGGGQLGNMFTTPEDYKFVHN